MMAGEPTGPILATPLVAISSGATASLQSHESGASSINVPRFGPVNFAKGWWVEPEFEDAIFPAAISSKIRLVFRRHLWPINMLQNLSTFFFVLFALVFSCVWITWLHDLYRGITECTKEETLEPFVWFHRIIRLVFFLIGTIMQLCLHLYFRSDLRMKKLEARLNAVSMEPGASELALKFKLVPYKTVDHVLNYTFFLKKTISELKHAYRNKVDFFEIALEDEECPLPENRPTKSCEVCLLEDVAPCLSDKVKRLADSVEQAKRSAEQLAIDKARLVSDLNLNFDHLLAIQMYTFDLDMFVTNSRKVDNFYYQFNFMYRDLHGDLQGDFWESCSGYLFFLLEGLRRLKPFSLQENEFLYRGVDKKCAKLLRKRYQQVGKRIVWAAFSSAATEEQIAAEFSEDGGIVFRIRLLPQDSNSRNISEFSMYPNEQEVLLLPNFQCIVDKSPHTENNVEYVDLVEIRNDTFVT